MQSSVVPNMAHDMLSGKPGNEATDTYANANPLVRRRKQAYWPIA